MWKAESHYNECPSRAIAQLTLLCQRSDCLVSLCRKYRRKASAKPCALMQIQHRNRTLPEKKLCRYFGRSENKQQKFEQARTLAHLFCPDWSSSYRNRSFGVQPKIPHITSGVPYGIKKTLAESAEMYQKIDTKKRKSTANLVDECRGNVLYYRWCILNTKIHFDRYFQGFFT